MTAIVILYGTHQGFKVLRGLLFEIFEIFLYANMKYANLRHKDLGRSSMVL